MTNRERLVSLISFDAPADAIEGALIDAELNGNLEYTKDQSAKVKAAAVEVLRTLLVSSISEGGYSITYDRKAIESRIAFLNGAPRARFVNVM